MSPPPDSDTPRDSCGKLGVLVAEGKWMSLGSCRKTYGRSSRDSSVALPDARFCAQPQQDQGRRVRRPPQLPDPEQLARKRWGPGVSLVNHKRRLVVQRKRAPVPWGVCTELELIQRRKTE